MANLVVQNHDTKVMENAKLLHLSIVLHYVQDEHWLLGHS